MENKKKSSASSSTNTSDSNKKKTNHLLNHDNQEEKIVDSTEISSRSPPLKKTKIAEETNAQEKENMSEEKKNVEHVESAVENIVFEHYESDTTDTSKHNENLDHIEIKQENKARALKTPGQQQQQKKVLKKTVVDQNSSKVKKQQPVQQPQENAKMSTHSLLPNRIFPSAPIIAKQENINYKFRIYITQPNNFLYYITFLQKNGITELNFYLVRTTTNKNSGQLIISVGQISGMYMDITYPVIITDDHVLKKTSEQNLSANNGNDNSSSSSNNHIQVSIDLPNFYQHIKSLCVKDIDSIIMVLTNDDQLILSNRADYKILHEEHALFIMKLIVPTNLSTISMRENTNYISKFVTKENLSNVFAGYTMSQIASYNLQFEVTKSTKSTYGVGMENTLALLLLNEFGNVVSSHSLTERDVKQENIIKKTPNISLIPAKHVFNIVKNLQSKQEIQIDFSLETVPMLFKIKNVVYELPDLNIPGKIMQICSYMKIWIAAKIISDEEEVSGSNYNNFHGKLRFLLPKVELNEIYEVVDDDDDDDDEEQNNND